MKKKFLICLLIVVSLFVFTSCTSKKESYNKNSKEVENEKNEYIKYVNKLKKVKKSTDDLPFTVEVKYEKMNDEIRYQVIIDDPKENINNIKAIAIHNKQTDDVFPSVGIFDKKVDLVPNKKPSGVILVGYFPYKDDIEDLDVEMKVLISYKIDNKKYTAYYLTKK